MEVETIQDRLVDVRGRIEAACSRAGRNPVEVELVAVSKVFPPESVREAADCGLTVFGESRVQEARAKIPLCPGHLSWHLIGHLQTNKARVAVGLFDVIHSVDSTKVLEAVNNACEQGGREVSIYLEVNISGEGSKHGVTPEGLRDVLEKTVNFPRLNVLGLMTIPPFAEDVEKTRMYFAALRELLGQCNEEWGFPMDGLSMGMTHDFEIAIEEGATCVRVGTALFGKRSKKK